MRNFLHMQEYAAPEEIREADVRRRRNEPMAAARGVSGPTEQVAMESRERGKGGSRYGRFEQRRELLVMLESGVLLQVNLFDCLGTGLFLDHRPLRRHMATESRGKRFLNLALNGFAGTTGVLARC